LHKLKIASALLVLASLSAGGVGYFQALLWASQPAPTQSNGRSVLGVFAGSSPCDDTIRALLQIPADLNVHMIQWKLTLYQDPQTLASHGYELQCKYGITAPNKPGLDQSAKTLE